MPTSAPDTIFAATKTKAAPEAINYGIDFTRLLKGAELLTAGQVPVITVLAGAGGLTFGAATVNSSPFTDDFGNTVAVGCGVQVSIAGGNPLQTYEILLSCTTTATPANTRTGGLRLFIER